MFFTKFCWNADLIHLFLIVLRSWFDHTFRLEATAYMSQPHLPLKSKSVITFIICYSLFAWDKNFGLWKFEFFCLSVRLIEPFKILLTWNEAVNASERFEFLVTYNFFSTKTSRNQFTCSFKQSSRSIRIILSLSTCKANIIHCYEKLKNIDSKNYPLRGLHR